MTKPYKYSALTLISVGIMIFRDYTLFTAPRLWAEEGTIYFTYATSHGWLASLLKPHQGYYSLFSNFAGLLASRAVSLESAPLVTTLLAFIVQCVPLLIVIWGTSRFWDTFSKKVGMIAIILFTPLSTEIWLNTINSQFYFSLITFLILCEDTATIQIRKYCYRFLLVISGLTGAVSCFIAPLYIAKAWMTKRREVFVQAGIISSCALLQVIIVIFLAASSDGVYERRSFFPDIPTLGVIMWIKNIALLFYGLPFAKEYMFYARQAGATMFGVLGYGGLLVTLMLLSCLALRLDREKRIYIFGSYLLLMLLSTFCATGDKKELIAPWGGQRYYYVPNVLILTMVLLAANRKFKTKAMKIFSWGLRCLLILALLHGAAIYIHFSVRDKTCPKWTEEIEQWNKDSSHSVKISPPGWEISLQEHKQR